MGNPQVPGRSLPAGEETHVTVEAAEYWNDTGLDVAAGEEYALFVSGPQTWTDKTITCGANGYTGLINWLSGPWKRFPDRLFTLIGTIGQDESHAFRIGDSRPSWSPPIAGRLFVYANDVPRFYSNNHGTLDLTIRRTR